MRLAVIQDTLRTGGTETQSLLLAKAWQDRGHTVHLVTFRPGGALQPRVEQLQLVHHSLQRWDWGAAFWAPGLVRYLVEKQVEGVLLMGRNANRKGAVIATGIPDLRVIGTCRTGRKLVASYRRSLLAVDRVVANSQWAADRVLKIGVAREKISVISNALTLSWKSGERETQRKKIRDRHRVKEDTIIFLQVASFIKGKNHSDLLECVAGLDADRQPWELWLVGDGPTRRAVRQMAGQLRVAERVRFFGFQDDVKPFYAGADVFLSTSLEESLPNALIEAQASGLPVVAYDTAGVSEAFHSGVSGVLCPPGDLDTFLQAMNGLAENRDQLLEMGRAGRAYAARFPTPESQGAHYLALFED